MKGSDGSPGSGRDQTHVFGQPRGTHFAALAIGNDLDFKDLETNIIDVIQVLIRYRGRLEQGKMIYVA